MFGAIYTHATLLMLIFGPSATALGFMALQG